MTPTPGASRIQSYHAHRLDAVDREPLSLDVLWPEDRRDAHPDPPTSSKVLPRPAHVDPDLYPLFDGALAPIETDNWAYRLGCVQRADYKVGLDDVAARAARAASCALPPDIVPVRNRGRGPYGGSFQSPKLLGMYEAQAGVALYAQAVGNPGCGLTVLGVLTRTLARSVPSMHGLARKMTDLHAILFEDANAPYLLEDARINSRGGRSFTLTTTVEEVKAGLVVPSHHHLLDSTPAGRAFRCAVVKGAAEIAQEALSFMLSADEYQQLCDEGELIVCPAAVVGAASHAEQVNPATYGGGMRDLGALQMSLHSDSGDAKRWTVFIVFFRSFEDPDAARTFYHGLFVLAGLGAYVRMDDDALVLLFHGLLPHGGTEFAHGLQDQFGNLPPAAAAELANVLARVGIVVYIKDSVFRAKARPLFEGAGPGYGIYTPAPEVAQHQTSSTFLDAPLARLSFGGSEAHLNYLMRHHALARCFADVELARRYGTPMPVSLTAYLPLQTDFVDPDTGTTFRLTPPRIDPILEPERVRRIAARSEGLDWPLDVIYFSTDRLQRQLQSLTHRALAPVAKRQLWRFANDTSAAPYPKRPPAPRPSRAVAGPAQIVHKSLALPAASLSDDEGRESEDEASERDDAAGKPAETHTRPTRVAAQSKRPTRVANDVLAVRPGPEPTAARAMVTVDSLDSARAAAAAQRQAVRPMSEEPLDLAATDDEGDTPPPLTISPVPPRGPPPRLTEDRVRMPASAQAVARAQQYERIAHAAAEDDQTFAIDSTPAALAWLALVNALSPEAVFRSSEAAHASALLGGVSASTTRRQVGVAAGVVIADELMSKLDGDVPMTLNDIQPVLPPAFLNAVAALHNLRVEEAALDRQARIVAVRRVRLEVLLMQCFYRWVMPIARQLARALVALVGPVQTRKLPGARTRKKRVTAIGSFEALAKAVGADALAFPPAYRPLVLATLEHLRFSAQRPATNRSSSPPPPIGILLAAPLAEPFGVDTTALGLHVVLPMPRDVRVQSDLTHDGFADAFAATFGRLWIAVFIRPQLASIPLEARQASSGGRALVDDAQLEVAPADQLITRVAFAIAIAQGLRTADVFYDATFLRAYKDGTARILLSSDKAASQTYPSLSHDILGSPVQHSETVRPLARGARALAEADEDVAIALADQAAVYDLFAGNRTPRTLRRRQAGPQVPLADEQAATPADGLLLLAAVLAPGLAVHVLGLAEDENPLARLTLGYKPATKTKPASKVVDDHFVVYRNTTQRTDALHELWQRTRSTCTAAEFIRILCVFSKEGRCSASGYEAEAPRSLAQWREQHRRHDLANADFRAFVVERGWHRQKARRSGGRGKGKNGEFDDITYHSWFLRARADPKIDNQDIPAYLLHFNAACWGQYSSQLGRPIFDSANGTYDESGFAALYGTEVLDAVLALLAATNGMPTFTQLGDLISSLKVPGLGNGLTRMHCLHDAALLGLARHATAAEIAGLMCHRAHKGMGAARGAHMLQLASPASEAGSLGRILAAVVDSMDAALARHGVSTAEREHLRLKGMVAPAVLEHAFCKLKRFVRVFRGIDAVHRHAVALLESNGFASTLHQQLVADVLPLLT